MNVNNKFLKILFIFLISFIFIEYTFATEDIEVTSEYNDIIQSEEQNDVEIEIPSQLDNISENVEYSYINETTKYKVVIEDDAHLLSSEEISKLEKDMIPLTEYGNIAFKTIDSNSYSSTSTYASNYYHSNFGTSSGTVFIIDMDKREIYIFSDGENYKTITSSKAYSITDNVYLLARNVKYYLCAHDTFEQIKTLLDGGKIMEPMKHISNVVIALTVAAFINFFMAMSNSKLKVAGNKEILEKCKIIFNIGDVTGTKTGTHRVYSPQSDGGSSGGGGGGGGGGSSGGGGGHGF